MGNCGAPGGDKCIALSVAADERLKQIEDTYWDEFEKHDLANVIVLRGGRG